jgi:lysophospholipase L1-like esterase
MTNQPNDGDTIRIFALGTFRTAPTLNSEILIGPSYSQTLSNAFHYYLTNAPSQGYSLRQITTTNMFLLSMPVVSVSASVTGSWGYQNISNVVAGPVVYGLLQFPEGSQITGTNDIIALAQASAGSGSTNYATSVGTAATNLANAYSAANSNYTASVGVVASNALPLTGGTLDAISGRSTNQVPDALYSAPAGGGTFAYGPSGGQTNMWFVITNADAAIQVSDTITALQVVVGPLTGLTDLRFDVYRDNPYGNYDTVGTTTNLVPGLVANSTNIVQVSIPGILRFDHPGWHVAGTFSTPNWATNYFPGYGTNTLWGWGATNLSPLPLGTNINWSSIGGKVVGAPAIMPLVQAPPYEIIGDSRYSGKAAGGGPFDPFVRDVVNNYQYTLSDILNNSLQVPVLNASISGQQVNNFVARWTADVLSRHARAVVVTSAAGNGFGAGLTASQIASAITNMAGISFTNGIQLYVTTDAGWMYSSDYVSAGNSLQVMTNADALNATILAMGSNSVFGVKVIDVRSVIGVADTNGPPGNTWLLNPEYTPVIPSDYIHWNNAGQRAVARAINAALMSQTMHGDTVSGVVTAKTGIRVGSENGGFMTFERRQAAQQPGLTNTVGGGGAAIGSSNQFGGALALEAPKPTGTNVGILELWVYAPGTNGPTGDGQKTKIGELRWDNVRSAFNLFQWGGTNMMMIGLYTNTAAGAPAFVGGFGADKTGKVGIVSPLDSGNIYLGHDGSVARNFSLDPLAIGTDATPLNGLGLEIYGQSGTLAGMDLQGTSTSDIVLQMSTNSVWVAAFGTTNDAALGQILYWKVGSSSVTKWMTLDGSGNLRLSSFTTIGQTGITTANLFPTNLAEVGSYSPNTVATGTNYVFNPGRVHFVSFNSATNCTLTLPVTTNEIAAIIIGGATNLTVKVNGNGWFYGNGASGATAVLAATNVWTFTSLDTTGTNFGYR